MSAVILMAAGAMLFSQDNKASDAAKGGVAESKEWKASALRPGDVLSISVFRVPEFRKDVRIDEDGLFVYPL